VRLPCLRPHPFLLALALGCTRAEETTPLPEVPAPETPPVLSAARCVYFKDLRPFLPRELQGYALSRDEGSTGKYGEVVMSEAERAFTRPGQQMVVRIVDTTLVGRLSKSIRAAADEADRHEAEETASLRMAETVGFVRYDPSEERAEANLLVGGRYVVAVTGLGFEGTHEVKAVAGGLDLEGLSRLR